MAHNPHNTIQEIINDTKKEDHKAYLEFINRVNKANMDSYEASTLLRNEYINELTDNQLELLKSIGFKNGDRISVYDGYNNPVSKATKRWNTINTSFRYYNRDFDIFKEDLKFVTTYTINKWKKLNPTETKRKAKGTQFEFAMNEFSLTLFIKTSTKKFLRTEAKNYVIKVNEAFDKSDKENKEISIRNRFYAFILDNTDVHTKTMLDKLYSTNLSFKDNTLYIPHKDEALVLPLGWYNREFISLPTYDAMDNYSNDTTICTHMNTETLEEGRILARYFTAISIMTTLFNKTPCEVYKDLADRMVSNLPTDKKIKLHNLTNSITLIDELVKTKLKEKED